MSCGSRNFWSWGQKDSIEYLLSINDTYGNEETIESFIKLLKSFLESHIYGDKSTSEESNSSLFPQTFFLNSDIVQIQDNAIYLKTPLNNIFSQPKSFKKALFMKLIDIFSGYYISILGDIREAMLYIGPPYIKGKMCDNEHDYDDGIDIEANDILINKLEIRWVDYFIDCSNVLLEYLEDNLKADLIGNSVEKLALLYILILYIIISHFKSDKYTGNYLEIVNRMQAMEFSNYELYYWFVTIVIQIRNLGIYSLECGDWFFDLIFKYQYIQYGWIYYKQFTFNMIMRGNYDAKVLTLCKKWVSVDQPLLKQIVNLLINKNISLTQRKFESVTKPVADRMESSLYKNDPDKINIKNEDGDNSLGECIVCEDFQKDHENDDSIDTLNNLCYELIFLLSNTLGIVFKDNTIMTVLDNNYKRNGQYVEVFVIVDLLEEIISNKKFYINHKIFNESLRLLICNIATLAALYNPRIGYSTVNMDVISNNIEISYFKDMKFRKKLHNHHCNLFLKIFIITDTLISRSKSISIDNPSYSLLSISSCSSLSSLSQLSSSSLDISLFLILWTNYSLLAYRNYTYFYYYGSILNNAMLRCFGNLVKLKYSLDVLCEITFLMSDETKGNIPLIFYSKLHFIKVLWTQMWRIYCLEIKDIYFEQEEDNVENYRFYSIPYIKYFVEFLLIFDKVANTTNIMDDAEEDHSEESLIFMDYQMIELVSVICSALFKNNLDSVDNKICSLMAIISILEDPSIFANYIHSRIIMSQSIDYNYIRDCLRKYSKYWNCNIRVIFFASIVDLYIILQKQSLFSIIKSLIFIFDGDSGVFEKSFYLYKIRVIRSMISNSDYLLLQDKLINTDLYSISDLDSDCLVKDEIFFGCYSIDLYSIIQRIQHGLDDTSISASPSSLSTTINKKHSSLVITDSEIIYDFITKLNPLYERLIYNLDEINSYIRYIGNLIYQYYYYVFNSTDFRVHISEFTKKFAIESILDNFEDSTKYVGDEHFLCDEQKSRDLVLYSKLIIRLVFISVWIICKQSRNKFKDLSRLCLFSIVPSLFGLDKTDGINKSKYFSSNILEQYQLTKTYLSYISIIQSLLFSLDADSISAEIKRITSWDNLKCLQIYLILCFLNESKKNHINYDRFYCINIRNLFTYIKYTDDIYFREIESIHNSSNIELIKVQNQHESIESILLHNYILFISLALSTITLFSEIRSYCNRVTTFKYKQGSVEFDDLTEDYEELINNLISCIWNFYESYPTLKDLFVKVFLSNIATTEIFENVCSQLYNKIYWQKLLSRCKFKSEVTHNENLKVNNLSINQYIAIEYIMEYYICNNTTCEIEKYIDTILASIINNKVFKLYESWLLLSFWKKYPNRFYKHIKLNGNTWIFDFIIEYLFSCSLMLRTEEKSYKSNNNNPTMYLPNFDLYNLFSFLLYNYYPQLYHDRLSNRLLKFYLMNHVCLKRNKFRFESKNWVHKVHSKFEYCDQNFIDYLHYIGHLLPTKTVIYLLCNQFASEKKKIFSSISHHSHYSLNSTVIIYSCMKSLLRASIKDWELLLLQYIEIIKSSKTNFELILLGLLDMALYNSEFAQILSLYANDMNSSRVQLLQKCIFEESCWLSDYNNNLIIHTNKDIIINRIKTINIPEDTLLHRFSGLSSLSDISKLFDLSQPNIQFTFFYILCELGEIVTSNFKNEKNHTKVITDKCKTVEWTNSKKNLIRKIEMTQQLNNLVCEVVNMPEFKDLQFLNINLLKSNYLDTTCMAINKVQKLRILQSAKNIPYLLSLELINDGNANKEPHNELKQYGLSVKGRSVSVMDLSDPFKRKCNINVIIKSNDDCRQDVITMQYIHVFQRIFSSCGIPVWLYPYRVLPMIIKNKNNKYIYGGIIEYIEKSISLHEIHEKHPGGLKEYFQKTFVQDKSKISYQQARYNFIASLAGYSIACYVLQIKDRHNGNLLVTKDGHIIHIDYGFIFDISPGNNLHFERAAFKVTQEMLELMENEVDLFDDLCLSGFLAVRNHADTLLSLTQLLLNSGIPCFRGNTIDKLKQRLLLNLTQQQASNLFAKKIHNAHNHITTKGYDLVQFIQQGIR
ncbi:phosphatidylinositol 3- and 4-kinase family protein [Cryptosporidium muris RN66]|uniref:Phosphatidylinositol 3-and 4-kinase family protein n=1 Tax=Cryptosporidium muris (strain RN66) TaxID=441375 RepID=B6AIG3_CRYMR|nr:phosphatidylinositol 3- and 4-kinase family protein [Cryptosporidium muris RN66]EEA08004.1 phosphatidylinositol 3- and 4-kinase family protein [Cryptosporidium muris RN66]|eukprot:XP_002142353.1 phosphatidylinositol 3- and 4-kinase family protein [Cryptosporidium muris RN66]